ncbi:FkbM family methyltransferase [Rasiella sp. SM2506]|uniref:FkbM family methyltransferase n=1 Tax=Rasiella sp. SM2506 TaxID=3423914 RepID=UPI003D7AD26D
MLFKNYYYLALASLSKKLGRGKYYRKNLFSTRRILEKNFPVASNFCFLQVGANDGVSFDSLYSFVTQRKISGIAIEPIGEYYHELCENYKQYTNIVCVNKAVHETETTATIYRIDSKETEQYPDWVKGIASFNKEHLTKFEFIDFSHIIAETVEAAHLMDIVSKTSFTAFDYFQIDTEGYDFKVINMFDFTNYKPKMVKAEYINLSDLEKKAITRKLKDEGYYVFLQGLDIIGINLRKIKL